MDSNRVVRVELTAGEVAVIRENAKKAELGGKSWVRGADRQAELAGDQYTAQAGEAALSKHLTGSIELYCKTREERNKAPWEGDGGSDLMGMLAPVDVKTSRMRVGEDFRYHLYVREREYHADTCYYLCLLPDTVDDIVYIVGWCMGASLPRPPAGSDRRELRMDKLNGMFAGI